MNETRYDDTILNIPLNIMPVEILDEVMRDVNEYAADDLEMTGVEALEDSMSIMDVGPREDLFYALFERDMDAQEDIMFLNLIHKLIAHAGTADQDMYND